MSTAKKERGTIFGYVCPKNGVLVTQTADKETHSTFFGFLVKKATVFAVRNCIWFLDNVCFHHAKRSKSLLERYKHRIEWVFLPPYSPDPNPIERVW